MPPERCPDAAFDQILAHLLRSHAEANADYRWLREAIRQLEAQSSNCTENIHDSSSQNIIHSPLAPLGVTGRAGHSQTKGQPPCPPLLKISTL